MENLSQFDLNFAIQRWRRALTQSPAMQGEDLDELESHLRDAVGDLKTRGLSEEEAALIAARRLGWVETLSREFGKVNVAVVWRDRAVWMLAGMLLMTVGWDLSGLIASTLTYVGSLTEPSGISLGWFSVAARMLTLGSVVTLFWLLTTGKLARWTTISTRLCQHPVRSAVILLGGMLLIKFLSFVFDTLSIRSLGSQTLGQTYAVTGWFNFVSPMLALVVMMVLFARLLSDRAQSAQGFRVAAWILVPLIAASLASSPVHAQTSAKSNSSTARSLGDKKEPATLEDAMKLWSAGRQDEAMAKFLAVDFSRRPLFPSGSVLNYTEAQFIALPQAARDKLSQQMLGDIRVLKEVSAHVRTAGKAAHDAGDSARADQCTAKLQQCGDAFDQPDSLALLKLVGKAFKKMSAGTTGAAK